MLKANEKGKRSHHGGAVFGLVSHPLDAREYVCADVLDAWFDPAPSVLSVLREDVGWMARFAPPADSSSLACDVAEWLGVDPGSVVMGAGSSDLIFRFFTRFLSASSKVFVLDPTYAEYRHVCESVIGCRIDSCLNLSSIDESYDLVVVVNPNNPTGELFSRSVLVDVLSRMRDDAVLWVDEAYMPFVEGGESMHGFSDPRLVVCQSLSKSLALSGLRAAFLTGCREVVSEMRMLTPPWNLSMPATLAVGAALGDLGYYEARYAETRLLRRELCDALSGLGVGDVREGAANWVTLFARGLVDACRSEKVLLRNGAGMFLDPPSDFVRVAVREREENVRILNAIQRSKSFS